MTEQDDINSAFSIGTEVTGARVLSANDLPGRYDLETGRGDLPHVRTADGGRFGEVRAFETIKHGCGIVAVVLAMAAPRLFALTDEDKAALKQFTEDYVLWDYSGHPVEFRERLDYDSFDEQRRILMRLAELQWGGVWGNYWRKLGVKDLEALRGLSQTDFWMRFHSVVKPKRGLGGIVGAKQIKVDIHVITEARAVAYVIYQATYPSRTPSGEGNIEVLRARRVQGEWRMMAIPRVTTALRKQLEAAERAK